MVGTQERRLQVVVLSARGLVSAGQSSTLRDGRRKVQLTLVSSRDPNGEAFGAKVSPWTAASDSQGNLGFGQSGLHCGFPLGASGPPAVRDARFADSAHLRVRLLTSMVPTISKDSALGTVASLLPSSLRDGVSQELDEATAQVEAEASIPLTNIVSGRVGFAADRALGGWVPLRKVAAAGGSPGLGEQIPMSLWMQMYVLPDHEAMVPMLKAQMEETITKQMQATKPQQTTRHQHASMVAAAAPAASGPSEAPRRWGPPKAAAAVGASPLPTSTNLIDVSLDDGPELVPATSSAPYPATSFTGPATVGGLLDLDDGAELIPANSNNGLFAGLSTEPPSSNSSSAFGFVAAGSPGASAFGFVAAGSPVASLDLAALYRDPGSVPAQVPQATVMPRFEELSSLVNSDLGLGSAQKAPPKADQYISQDGKSFQGLEDLALAGLNSSLKF